MSQEQQSQSQQQPQRYGGESGNPPTIPVPETSWLAAGSPQMVSSASAATDAPQQRKKVVLKPGFGLMGWYALIGKPGVDLAGTGGRSVPVPRSELRKHRTAEDLWLALKGKVYNVTAYMPYHPGGEEKLLMGGGKDATSLFDKYHAWVNYESLLAKCYIGPLVEDDPSHNPHLPPPS